MGNYFMCFVIHTIPECTKFCGFLITLVVLVGIGRQAAAAVAVMTLEDEWKTTDDNNDEWEDGDSDNIDDISFVYSCH